MKEFEKCSGCGAPKMLNRLGLCKRCNKSALDLLSPEELQKIKEQHEAELASEAARKAKEAEKAAAKEAAAAGAGDAAEGEEGAAPEGEKPEGEKPEGGAEGAPADDAKKEGE